MRLCLDNGLGSDPLGWMTGFPETEVSACGNHVVLTQGQAKCLSLKLNGLAGLDEETFLTLRIVEPHSSKS